jgi:hypothetical protein
MSLHQLVWRKRNPLDEGDINEARRVKKLAKSQLLVARILHEAGPCLSGEA